MRRLRRFLGTTIYRAGEDQPRVWVPENKVLASKIVDLLNHGAQASMNLNAETAALCKKYGAPRVDYFIGGTWRLWWTELHTHPGVGISSGLSSQGSTLEEAIARMKDHIAKYVVQKGGNCRLGCPEYSEDLY